MKKNILLLLGLLLCVMYATAQSTPEAFLRMLPKVPTIDCNQKSSQQMEANLAFRTQITSTQDALSDAIKKEKQKNKNQQLSKNVKEQAAAQSGLSEEELKIASNKKTSKAEKDRLTSKSVENQTGFSMEQMQEVKRMSKEDRKKWAMENYGKVMENEQQKVKETRPSQAQNVSLPNLAQEQQRIAENLQYHYARIDKKKQDVELLAAQQQLILDRKLKEISARYKDVNDGEGSTKADMAKLQERDRLIRKAKVEFCSKLTPVQLDYLITYESVLKSNILPDLNRTEEIEYEIRKKTFSKAEKSIFEQLRAIEKYSGALNKAFDYYLPVD